MTQPVPVGGGRFEVDMSRAPEAIRELEQARSELRSIRDDALSLSNVVAPTLDRVTQDAARVLSRKASGEPGSFMEALDSGIAEVTRMIEALRAGFARYRESDEQVRASLARES
ncbi:hypothetical protein [Actinomycetospora aeridis]|uniref:PE family protein n=1 Tax=Actinomycetospora aeridis TaxID=3129231 RepID=A0ABU8N8X9_9PSEU